MKMRRREFLKTVALSAAAAPFASNANTALQLPDYRGPNVIIVRFGGGVRRHETIDPQHSYCRFFLNELVPRGTFYPRMTIDQFQDINTSHGEGTLYIASGKYEKFKGIGAKIGDKKFLDARFEASVPTLFEYLRAAYNVPEYQTLIVNSEDRGDEEFYNFSNHHLYGAQFKSNTLSLRRFKTWLLRKQITEGKFNGKQLAKERQDLKKMESIDYRHEETDGQVAELQEFWRGWAEYYGESGFVNPRGDRLLTTLAMRAMRELRPRLMMINYTDPDYVHWGNPHHYTQAISIIDQELGKLDAAVRNDPNYCDNTVFVIVPDCGRDSNPYTAVPFQHHFNSRSAHEIFALFVGTGIDRGAVVDKPADQIQVASTVGRLMKVPTPHADGRILEEVFA
ncbi:MAG TPA: hypothetical protein VK850_15225 [Candidatus Binatia bacterium]|nr:hypothetical protein [Candidatus Binatia bacterium]